MEQQFDAIVVGAGPAGCACAHRLSKAGLQVLVVERGKSPGAKNSWGGALFGPDMGQLIPNFLKENAYERLVSRRRFSMVTERDCFSIDYSSPRFSENPDGFILLRSKFDRWFSNKVQEAGAIIAAGVQADDVMRDGNGRVAGIIAGGDRIHSSMVIACDGVNSLLAQKVGLRQELKPHEVKQGVKEVIQLPREVLEQRFHLSGKEGIAWEFVGACTGGLPGGGFIYTNADSLSVGVVVQLSALEDKGVKANDLLNSFKAHPEVARYLEGGKLVEYSAHLIPVMGVNMMPRLFTDGFLVAGDAAALVLGTGLILEGANFAIASGLAAAEATIRARERNDYSAASLRYYQELLERGYALKDLRTFRKAPHFLENSRIYSAYPEVVCSLAGKLFTTDGKPRERTWSILRQAMKGKVSLVQVVRDLLQARDAI